MDKKAKSELEFTMEDVINKKKRFVFDADMVTDDANSDDLDNEQIKPLTYKCEGCGCEFVSASYNPISSCIFCGSREISKKEESSFDKTYMLNFVDTLTDAVKDYKKKVYFNPLIPHVFRKKKVIKKMRKAYVPGILYDLEASGNVSFLAADRITNLKNSPTQGFLCEYKTEFKYNKLMNCTFSFVSDEMFSEINQYNYSVLKEFDSNLLKDSFIFCPNEDNKKNLENIEEKASKYSLSIIRNSINHELKKVKDNNLKFKVKSTKNVLVPVYLLNVKYKDENYLYIKNGQTGESTIDYAILKMRIVLFGLVVFVVLFIGISLLIFLI